MNILAEFKKLKETVAGFSADQSKATLASITEFSARLNGLEAGALAELSTAQASVTSLTTEKTTLTTSVTELTGKLAASDKTILDTTTALRAHMAKVDAAYAPGGAQAACSIIDLVTAEINATNSALAKTGVEVDKLPAAPASGGGAAPTAPQKFATLDAEIAWNKAHPQA
jgi:chromosome segregation ATPase